MTPEQVADQGLTNDTPWALMALAVLAALLLAAAVIDWRGRRIPNTLVALGAASAAVQQALLPLGLHPASVTHPGTPGLASGAWAALVTVLVAGSLWRLKWWGAGDAKWMTVLAAHAGPALVLPRMVLTALAGGLLALAWKTLGRRDRMPYALAIAAGELALMGLLANAPPLSG
jgi:prepilin peptidase CpaA